MVHYLYDKVKLKMAVVVMVAEVGQARKDNYFYRRLTSL